VAILQHYYTSFVDRRTGEGGFRTKAATPGLRPEVQGAVLKLIAYRIPATADERVVESHPVALRYAVLGPSEAVVSCVRSCGTDENGRPGNVFAHTLVAPPQELPPHPISLWRHAAWKREDASDERELPVLPPLGRAPPPDPAAVRAFLDEPGRGERFAGLLDAVARSAGPGGRRGVVVDDPDRVALWIAALSLALPPSLRSQLTFSTYHHDPYQAPFVVTGTTRDSSFRLSTQDFLQYFVVDEAEGRTSDGGEPGPFARFAAGQLRSPDGPEGLEPFHAFCDRRGEGAGLDGGVDRLARLWTRLGQPPEGAPDADEAELLRSALDEVVRAAGRSADDAADLALIADTARPLLASAGDPGLLDAYCRAVRASGADGTHRLYLRDDLEAAAALACGGREPEARRLLEALSAALGAGTVRAGVDTPEMAALLAGAAGGRPAALAAGWECFGPLRSLDRGPDPLLDATFTALDEASAEGVDEPPQGVLPLLGALRTAAAGREAALLARALEWRRVHGGPAAEWLYYQMAGRLPLEERHAHRALVEAEVDDITHYEVACDLRRTPPEGVRPLLDAWTRHLRDRPGGPAGVVGTALGELWSRAGESARPALARDILGWEELGPLLGARWEEVLVQAAFADPRGVAAPELLARFVAHPALPPEARTLMETHMATARGALDPGSIERMQQRFAGLPAEDYRREVAPLLARFLSPQVPLAEYANAVRAAYARQHDAVFWEVHWHTLAAAVSALPAAGIAARFGLGRSGEADEAVEVRAAWLVAFLELWFDRALPLVAERPYLGPRFFLTLPGALAEFQRTRAWRPLARAVERRAGTAPWYPFVETWFVPRPPAAAHTR
jgi:hypothetical protein